MIIQNSIRRPADKIQNSGGQAMIITVVMMGGILLSATAIAGLLLVYQIRQSNDSVSSAKAFFAADAGMEAVSWCWFKGCPGGSIAAPVMTNFESTGVSMGVISTIVPQPGGGNALKIIATGFAADRKIIRILEAEFEQ